MTTTAVPPPTRLDVYRRYVTWIDETCAKDPGARVALRRGLRRGLDDVQGLHRLVAGWLPDNCSPAEERAFYAVAAMIADRPRHSFTTGEQEPDTGEEAGDAGGETATMAKTAVGQERQVRVRRDSLGAAFARAVPARPGQPGVRLETAEARLNLLTRQSLEGLHRHLPGSIRLLRTADTGIDFAVLLDDLASWPRYSKTISRRWLQDFYRLRRAALEAAARNADTEADEAADADD
ncbi:type I-E CRISPR-associated protein Cse2/CasB [Streptomyces sp. NPDC047000]|uniref:type I-E CRISPR-associated protein Cse2/CasB n=1 Tax=Streptomyces sp. NPDC047000 TaxID=3155474 RepID=UPI0033FDA9A9